MSDRNMAAKMIFVNHFNGRFKSLTLELKTQSVSKPRHLTTFARCNHLLQSSGKHDREMYTPLNPTFI